MHRHEEQDALRIFLGAQTTEELRRDGDSISPEAFELFRNFASLLTFEKGFRDNSGFDLDALGQGFPSEFDSFEDGVAFGPTPFSPLSAPDGFDEGVIRAGDGLHWSNITQFERLWLGVPQAVWL